MNISQQYCSLFRNFIHRIDRETKRFLSTLLFFTDKVMRTENRTDERTRLTMLPKCIYLELWVLSLWPLKFSVEWSFLVRFSGKLCLHFIMYNVATNMKCKSTTMSDEMFRFYLENDRNVYAAPFNFNIFSRLVLQYAFHNIQQRAGNKIIKGKLSFEHQTVASKGYET